MAGLCIQLLENYPNLQRVAFDTGKLYQSFVTGIRSVEGNPLMFEYTFNYAYIQEKYSLVAGVPAIPLLITNTDRRLGMFDQNSLLIYCSTCNWTGQTFDADRNYFLRKSQQYYPVGSNS